MIMDGKVHGTLIKNKDGREIPADEFIVFRPSDDAVPDMLVFYRNLLVKQGASKEQVEAVVDLECRVREWRLEHPGRCKVADVSPGELQLGEDSGGGGSVEDARGSRPRLAYSKERPASSGFYFVEYRCQLDGRTDVAAVRVYRLMGEMHALFDGVAYLVDDEIFLRFAGPISLPEE